MIDGLVNHLAPLGVLPEPDVVALERMRYGASVRLFPVAEEEAGRHFLTHSITADLIEAQSVSMTLYKSNFRHNHDGMKERNKSSKQIPPFPVFNNYVIKMARCII